MDRLLNKNCAVCYGPIVKEQDDAYNLTPEDLGKLTIISEDFNDGLIDQLNQTQNYTLHEICYSRYINGIKERRAASKERLIVKSDDEDVSTSYADLVHHKTDPDKCLICQKDSASSEFMSLTPQSLKELQFSNRMIYGGRTTYKFDLNSSIHKKCFESFTTSSGDSHSLEEIENACLICKETLQENFIMLTPKKCEKLDFACKKRKVESIRKIIQNEENLRVHDDCFDDYTNHKSISKMQKYLDDTKSDASFEDDHQDSQDDDSQSDEETADSRDTTLRNLNSEAEDSDETPDLSNNSSQNDSGINSFDHAPLCPICDSALEENFKKLTIKQREKLKAASEKRQDDIIERTEDVDELQVHDKCFTTYTHHASIARAIRELKRAGSSDISDNSPNADKSLDQNISVEKVKKELDTSSSIPKDSDRSLSWSSWSLGVSDTEKFSNTSAFDHDKDKNQSGYESSQQDCFICSQALVNNVFKINSKQKEKIITTCLERREILPFKIGEDSDILVHEDCFENYTKSSSVERQLGERSSPNETARKIVVTNRSLNQNFNETMPGNDPEELNEVAGSQNNENLDETELNFSVREQACSICGTALGENILEVNLKQRERLIAASEKREDNLISKFEETEELQVHEMCFKNYTHYANVTNAQKFTNNESRFADTPKLSSYNKSQSVSQNLYKEKKEDRNLNKTNLSNNSSLNNSRNNKLFENGQYTQENHNQSEFDSSDEEQNCLICEKALTDNFVKLGPKQREKLINASHKRQDNKALEFDKIEEVHEKCIRVYTHHANIAKAQKLHNESNSVDTSKLSKKINQSVESNQTNESDSADDDHMNFTPRTIKNIIHSSMHEPEEKSESKNHENDSGIDSSDIARACPVCNEALEDNITRVDSKQRDKLVKASQKRGDDLASKIQDFEDLQMHEVCFQSCMEQKKVTKVQKKPVYSNTSVPTSKENPMNVSYEENFEHPSGLEVSSSEIAHSCPICDQDLTDDILQLAPKQKERLVAVSQLRADNMVDHIISFEGLRAHGKCFRRYTHYRNVAKYQDSDLSKSEDSEVPEKPKQRKRRASVGNVKELLQVEQPKHYRRSSVSNGDDIQVSEKPNKKDKTTKSKQPQENGERKRKISVTVAGDQLTPEEPKRKRKVSESKQKDQPKQKLPVSPSESNIEVPKRKRKISTSKEDQDAKEAKRKRRISVTLGEDADPDNNAKPVNKYSVKPAIELIDSYFHEHGANCRVLLPELLYQFEKSRERKFDYKYLVRKLREIYAEDLTVIWAKENGPILIYKIDHAQSP